MLPADLTRELSRGDLRLLQPTDMWAADQPVLVRGAFLVEMAFERGKTQRLLTKHSVFWEHIDAASPGSRFEATDRRDSPDGAVLGWQFRRQEASKPARTCGDGRDEPPEEGSILREIFCLASVLQDEHRSLVVPAKAKERVRARDPRRAESMTSSGMSRPETPRKRLLLSVPETRTTGWKIEIEDNKRAPRRGATPSCQRRCSTTSAWMHMGRIADATSVPLAPRVFPAPPHGMWDFQMDAADLGYLAIRFADGTVYTGDTGHPYWMYLRSRKTGVLYRVCLSHAWEEAGPHEQHVSSTIDLGDSTSQAYGVAKILHLIEAAEAEPARLKSSVEALPLVQQLQCMLDDTPRGSPWLDAEEACRVGSR